MEEGSGGRADSHTTRGGTRRDQKEEGSGGRADSQPKRGGQDELSRRRRRLAVERLTYYEGRDKTRSADGGGGWQSSRLTNYEGRDKTRSADGGGGWQSSRLTYYEGR